jgi:hypothetical protein
MGEVYKFFLPNHQPNMQMALLECQKSYPDQSRKKSHPPALIWFYLWMSSGGALFPQHQEA